MSDTTAELLTALMIGMIAALVLFGSGWCVIGWIVEADER